MENCNVSFLYEITEGNGKEDGFIMKRYEANLKTVYVPNKRQRQRRCLFIENNMKLLCE